MTHNNTNSPTIRRQALRSVLVKVVAQNLTGGWTKVNEAAVATNETLE